jgi:hypothetical protein
MVKEYYREFQGTTNDKDQDGVPFSWLETISKPEDTRISKELSKIIVKFISEIKNKFKIKMILHFSNSTIGLFNTIDGPDIKHCYLCYSNNILDTLNGVSEQLILCDLSAEDEQLSPPPYQALSRCIKRIKETDLAIIATSDENLSLFRKIIEENHASINGIFPINLSEKFTSHTNHLDSSGSVFIPFESGMYLLLIQKKGNINEYISQIANDKNIKKIIEEFHLSEKNENLTHGVLLKPREYTGERAFQRSLEMEKSKDKIENSSIDYKVYPRKKIGEIAVQLSIDSFKQKKVKLNFGNCLYLKVINFENRDKEKPLFSRWHKFSLEPDQELSNQSYLIVQFDENFVQSEYLDYFFNSKIGGLIKESITPNEYLSLEDIKNIWAYIPPIRSQREILSTIHKINESKNKLQEINFDLVLNPSAFNDATKKINKILDVFGELADFEKIKSRIYEGESKTLEFKQTFSLDISKQKKEKYIEDACIKTMAAFMNSDGGTLIVGIADNGDLVGLDDEVSMFYKNNDSFLLHVKNQIKNRIGEQFYPFINYRLVKLESKTLLLVECLPSNSEVYVDSKDFFVRTNPATDKLEGPKLVSYIKNHRNFIEH